MKKSHLYMSLLFGITAGFALPLLIQTPVHAEPEKGQVTKSGRQEELLATHQTEARYDGIQFIPCRFLTAQCPDKCGHARNVAVFTILKYLHYQKTGEYGSEQQTIFSIDVSSPVKPDSFESRVRKTISGLKTGDRARLDWKHIYVRDKNASFPEYPVTRLEPLETPAKD